MSENTLGSIIENTLYPAADPSHFAVGWHTKAQKAAEAVEAEVMRRHYDSLPPGDEGLAQVYWEARERVTYQQGDAPATWSRLPDCVQLRIQGGIAAVIAEHRRRLREDSRGSVSEHIWHAYEHNESGADAVLDYLDSIGWMGPQEVERLKEELSTLHTENRRRIVRIENLEDEVERLGDASAETARVREQRDRAWRTHARIRWDVSWQEFYRLQGALTDMLDGKDMKEWNEVTHDLAKGKTDG